MSNHSRYYYLEKPGVVKTFTYLSYVPKEDKPGSGERRTSPVAVLLVVTVLIWVLFAFVIPAEAFGIRGKVIILLAIIAVCIFGEKCFRFAHRDKIVEDRKKRGITAVPEGGEIRLGPDGEVEEARESDELDYVLSGKPLTEEEEEEAERLWNTENEGVEFDYEAGAVFRIGTFGSRKKVGEFSEIADFRFRKKANPIAYDYAIVWKNPMRAVLSFSPDFSRPERLAVYRDRIVPRLEAVLAEYLELHPEAAAKPDEGYDRLLADAGKTSLFHFNGFGHERAYWYEPLFLLAVCVGLAAWLLCSSYGWLGTGILATCLALAVLGFYLDDKRLVISPYNRMITVYAGFGFQTEEFGYDDFERIAIIRFGPVKQALLHVNGRSPIAILGTLDMNRAVAAVNEVCNIMDLDPKKVMTVE